MEVFEAHLEDLGRHVWCRLELLLRRFYGGFMEVKHMEEKTVMCITMCICIYL